VQNDEFVCFFGLNWIGREEVEKCGSRKSLLCLQQSPLGLRPVGAVDFSVDGVVVIAGREDSVVCLGQDGGEGSKAGSLRSVEHLRLELGELVLQFREAVGKGLHDAGVDAAQQVLIRSAQVLGTQYY